MAQKYAATQRNARALRGRGNEWVLFLPTHPLGPCILPYKTEGGARLGAKRFKPICGATVMTMDAFLALPGIQS